MEKKNQLPILSFYLDDWVFAVPMTLLLLVALALVIWRLLLNHGASSNLDVLLPDIQENLKRKGLPAAVALCQGEHGLIPSQMFVAGLEASEQGVAAMRRSMQAAAEHEILPRLNFLMPTILAIAKISTMVGLFGTVVSMIGTFSAISNPEGGAAGAGAMAAQSKKIGLALFATAYGLITAIPLVFCHVLFKAWIAKFEVRMKVAAQKLITLVQKVKSGEDDDDRKDDKEEDEEDRPRNRRASNR